VAFTLREAALPAFRQGQRKKPIRLSDRQKACFNCCNY
jgi:hypothetical protein